MVHVHLILVLHDLDWHILNARSRIIIVVLVGFPFDVLLLVLFLQEVVNVLESEEVHNAEA